MRRGHAVEETGRVGRPVITVVALPTGGRLVNSGRRPGNVPEFVEVGDTGVVETGSHD